MNKELSSLILTGTIGLWSTIFRDNDDYINLLNA